NAATAASSPAARGITSHIFGAAPPKNANAVVKIAGSGFHDGPPLMPAGMFESAKPWPQSIHAHGSELGIHESAIALMIASATQAMKATTAGEDRASRPRVAGWTRALAGAPLGASRSSRAGA